MADLSDFDFSVPGTNSGPVPAGDYNVMVTGSKVSAEDDRVRLTLITKVLDGEHEGGTLYLDFWLRHPSEGARKVGIRNFKDVCKACGYSDVPGDSSELHGNCMSVKTTLYQDKYVNLKSVKPYKAGSCLPGCLPGKCVATGGGCRHEDTPF
jgi:hypothetical protein